MLPIIPSPVDRGTLGWGYKKISIEEKPMAEPKITIALSHYDRHVPFFDGTVQAEGFDLNVLIVGQSDREFRGQYTAINK